MSPSNHTPIRPQFSLALSTEDSLKWFDKDYVFKAFQESSFAILELIKNTPRTTPPTPTILNEGYVYLINFFVVIFADVPVPPTLKHAVLQKGGKDWPVTLSPSDKAKITKALNKGREQYSPSVLDPGFAPKIDPYTHCRNSSCEKKILKDGLQTIKVFLDGECLFFCSEPCKDGFVRQDRDVIR